MENAQKKRVVRSPREGVAWCEGVEEVHLERCKLTTMYSFDKLPNLRRLFLSGNEITLIEGLQTCSVLEELILEENFITKVSTLVRVQ